MKISDENHIIDMKAYIQKINANEKGELKAQNRTAQAPSEEEKVEISSKARDIQKVKNILDDLPDVRMEKVDKIKRSLENGTYNVQGEKVAQKMVRESLLDEIL